MAKFIRGGVDVPDDALRTSPQQHELATAVMGGIGALDPTSTLQAVQQGHECRLFNSESLRNLCLSQGFRRNRQVEQGPPLRLTQPHRLEPLIELQSPGARRAVEQWTEGFRINLAHLENS